MSIKTKGSDKEERESQFRHGYNTRLKPVDELLRHSAKESETVETTLEQSKHFSSEESLDSSSETNKTIIQTEGTVEQDTSENTAVQVTKSNTQVTAPQIIRVSSAPSLPTIISSTSGVNHPSAQSLLEPPQIITIDLTAKKQPLNLQPSSSVLPNKTSTSNAGKSTPIPWQTEAASLTTLTLPSFVHTSTPLTSVYVLPSFTSSSIGLPLSSTRASPVPASTPSSAAYTLPSSLPSSTAGVNAIANKSLTRGDPYLSTFFNQIQKPNTPNSTQQHPITNYTLPPLPMASTTIREALGSLQADVRTPRYMAPEVYDPTKGSAETFLQNYDRCADMNNWKEQHKICYLESYLSGVAISWFRAYKNNSPNSKWEDIKAAFLHEYGNPNYCREIRFKLMNRKQRVDEDIKMYFYAILELCNKLPTFPSTEVIIDFFESGLHIDYLTQYNLLSTSNMSLEQLKTVVNKLSDIRSRAIAAHMTDPLIATATAGCNAVGNTRSPITQNNRKWVTERSRLGKPRCLYCKRLGHLAYACLNNPNNYNNRFNYSGGQGNNNFNYDTRQNPARNYSNQNSSQPRWNGAPQANQGNDSRWNSAPQANQGSNPRWAHPPQGNGNQSQNRWTSRPQGNLYTNDSRQQTSPQQYNNNRQSFSGNNSNNRPSNNNQRSNNTSQ